MDVQSLVPINIYSEKKQPLVVSMINDNSQMIGKATRYSLQPANSN